MQLVKITELAVAHPSTIYRSQSLADIRSIRELDKELRRRRTAEAWRDGAVNVPHGDIISELGKERAELVVQMNAEAVQRIFGREMDAEAI